MFRNQAMTKGNGHNMSLFESYERRIEKINSVLSQHGISSVEECREICKAAGFDPYEIVKGIQPICFENACWAYCVGAAIALKKNVQTAAEAAEAIGIGLQSFCIPGSVAEDRKVGLGHGNLGAMLLRDETKCFAFLAGHESFAAAEGAIGIVRNANKARKEPLRVILNGLGKDAAQIISRINGFTYVQTQFDYYTGELKIVREMAYSEGERAAVRCYGADDVREGVAVMHHEGVDVSITGNSTNPTRFQHPVAGTYKKECIEQGKKYFSVASGGGTGRTLHPDNMAAGPASYGMTDTMGRMHSDAQFAGSSSVPAHVEMMGFLGMGNNPMVGARGDSWSPSAASAPAVGRRRKQPYRLIQPILKSHVQEGQPVTETGPILLGQARKPTAVSRCQRQIFLDGHIGGSPLQRVLKQTANPLCPFVFRQKRSYRDRLR